jgi:triphosphoribosyl-dephospho-CoA synthase
VSGPAHVTLLEAMRAAAARDRIAYQYASGFEDVFGLGLRELVAARGEGANKELATLRVYVGFLSAFPDSHIVRKFGEKTGAQTLAEAQAFAAAQTPWRDGQRIRENALQWDAALKARGLNPGTSADLTVATLFADYAEAPAP